MRYETLGAVRIIGPEGPMGVNAHKRRVLLAAFLARSGRVTSMPQLIGEIWGGDAPRRARASLHVYVSQLRKVLHRDERERGPIRTEPLGYSFHLGQDEYDVQDFERLVNAGRHAMSLGDAATALSRVTEALALWRGPAFEGVSEGPILTAYVKWLEEMHLECLELNVEAHLRLGQHREMVAPLHTLTAEHPLHEKFYLQLMLALHRSERQAEALAVYRTARRRISRELGVEPCRPLRDAHQAILTGQDAQPLSAAGARGW
ncbi:AfsR/SARP family transcriptional regulator [Streptomyces sp. PT12]|uniref:AfsR/SARP family transcriptional regulator n=1 Tax=Streptomyces sp. PT12 TaxID=1510197 RepID=UPI000DE21037|nr:AfsR/SARP family transcriptional regulator [Streptomyces sp. PT12]RBM18686.1 activator protein [Streptomyces sp. PT12]